MKLLRNSEYFAKLTIVAFVIVIAIYNIIRKHNCIEIQMKFRLIRLLSFFSRRSRFLISVSGASESSRVNYRQFFVFFPPVGRGISTANDGFSGG